MSVRIGTNNAKYSWHRNSRELRLTATTDVAPGAEILAVYGRGYTSKIVSAVREQRVAADLAADEIAPIVWSRGAVQRMLCANCRKVVTKLIRLTHARCCFGRLPCSSRSSTSARSSATRTARLTCAATTSASFHE